MIRPGVWNRWVLLTIWVAQTCLLWQGATGQIWIIIINLKRIRLWFVHKDLPHRLNAYLVRVSLVFPLLYLICFALQIFEISSIRLRNLRPWLYLSSQSFKSLVYSFSFVVTWAWEFRFRGALNGLYWIFGEVPALFTLYIGLGYACYVFLKYQKLTRVISNDSHKVYSLQSQRLDKKHAAFLLPARINSASSVVAEIPWLIELIQWIFQNPDRAETISRPLGTVAKRTRFAIRYAVGIVYGFILLPTASYLPGRPQNPMEEDRQIHWDYIKPDLALDKYQDNFNEILNTTTIQDEESRMDYVRLHHLPAEADTTGSTQHHSMDRELAPATRLLRPRYLCFLTKTADDSSSFGYTVRRVDEWLAENNSRSNPDYVFISYTRKQFYTQRVFDPKISHGNLIQLKMAAERDRTTLADHAVKAAQDAGISAFWVDFECVRPEDHMEEESDMEDVYRICDIVRAAHSLSIVLGPPLDQQYEHIIQDASHKDEWILEWGMRMWTVPEALLCPSEHRVAVYTVGTVEAELVAKRNLAGRVWEDADVLRQLIDHYEGSLHLTQLELISIALECLQKRQTDPRNAGDVAYVLMGLLRLRPKVNKADSGFQAFARLSLANDSNKILERIMCLQNLRGHSSWHDMRDVWDAKLWYFDPLYQISDIGSCNTVVIGDAFGTVIDWTSLKAIDYSVSGGRFKNRWRLINGTAAGIRVFLGAYMFLSIVAFPILHAMDRSGNNVAQYFNLYFTIALGIPFALGIIVAIFLPIWLPQQLRSTFDKTEARLFGLQGKPDLQKVEALMFGVSCGRLKWSVDNLGDQNEDDSGTEFTLIDTHSCTAFTFRADKPPTLAFIGARERGMLRTLLCSYDHAARAFIKEAVVRFDGSVMQRLPHLDSFRFAVEAMSSYKDEVPSRDSWDDDAIEIPDIPEFRSLDPDT